MVMCLKHTLTYLHDVLIHDGLEVCVLGGLEGLECLEGILGEEDSTSSPISSILASYNYNRPIPQWSPNNIPWLQLACCLLW